MMENYTAIENRKGKAELKFLPKLEDRLEKAVRNFRSSKYNKLLNDITGFSIYLGDKSLEDLQIQELQQQLEANQVNLAGYNKTIRKLTNFKLEKRPEKINQFESAAQKFIEFCGGRENFDTEILDLETVFNYTPIK